jgi:RNA polymerase sigma-70 factor, ECF subfamily
MEATMLPGSRQPMDPPDPDVARLMNRFAGRDPSAAGELYQRFAPRIYGMGKAMLGTEAQAQELVKDTFVNLWRQAAGFDPGRGSLDQWVLLVAFRSIRRHAEALDSARGVDL